MTVHPIAIQVAIPLPVEGCFTYSVPDQFAATIRVGLRVMVPFGKRTLSAFVIKIDAEQPDYNIKSICSVLDPAPLFSEEMVVFFQWIANYYMVPIGEVIKHALPKGLEIRDRIGLRLTDKGRQIFRQSTLPEKEHQFLTQLSATNPQGDLFFSKRGQKPSSRMIDRLIQKGWIEKNRILSRQKVNAQMVQRVTLSTATSEQSKPLSKARKKIIAHLKAVGPIDLKELKILGSNAVALARKMHQDGQIDMVQQRVMRDPFGSIIAPNQPPRLTPEQLVAIARIKSSLLRKYQTYLLSGVTGSGKTEIYLQVTQMTISRGADVLILVPEIALISQMARRFRARFGDRVAVLHSGLSAGQRYDQWEQIVSGRFPICIGVRSAIFAPIKKIGLIVVDEEHDPSYKQEDKFYYNARDLAIVRGQQNDATVILGSATPSIQSYHNALNGKFIEIPLHQRVKNRPLPQIELVDLSKDREITGVRRFITPPLYRAIEHTLARGEQTLLFLNRRGFANFPICQDCGETFKCKHCDISLTLHKSINGFKCHFCGYTCAASTACPHCQSDRIRSLGTGTEKVEITVKQLFPNATVARMDRDTMSRKGALLKTLKDLKRGDIDILVGTQMVAKGHDFPNITLVGVICADLSLSFPDFRAGERTFQLLAQVAGRTGRGDRPGQVILQSYQCDHFSITAAQRQDFRRFYDHEIPSRKVLNYPPFSRLIQIKITGQNRSHTKIEAQQLATCCEQIQRSHPEFNSDIQILGPIEAPLFRVAGRYRYQMILKSQRSALLHRFTHYLRSEHVKIKKKGRVKVDINVDPYDMM